MNSHSHISLLSTALSLLSPPTRGQSIQTRIRKDLMCSSEEIQLDLRPSERHQRYSFVIVIVCLREDRRIALCDSFLSKPSFMLLVDIY